MALTSIDTSSIWEEILNTDPLSDQSKRLILVEDNKGQAQRIASAISDDWLIGVIHDPELVIPKLDKMKSHQSLVICLDLALIPGDDSLNSGLELLHVIRQKWITLPIVVISGLDHRYFALNVIAQIVREKASCIPLRDNVDQNLLNEMLPYVLDGCVVFSPTPAARLAVIAQNLIDPFAKNPEYWYTIRGIKDNLTLESIADLRCEMGVKISEQGIGEQVGKIYKTLCAMEQIVPSNRDADPKYRKSAIVRWAQNHAELVEYFAFLHEQELRNRITRQR